VPRRPAFVESAEKPRVLVCANAEVPGASAVGVRAEQLLLAFSGGLDLDALSLKGRNLTHIQRVGAARMLRVPVTEPVAGDGTAARSAFNERLAAFRRALTRQLDNDAYDVIVALDLFSAASALPSLGKARLVIEVSEYPSQRFGARYPVASKDSATRSEWEVNERAAMKAASLIVAPSRQAARHLSERTDPRHIRVVPRMVDTRIFLPPTVEVDLGDAHRVAFLGGREGGVRTAILQATLKLLGARTSDARFLLVGTPSRSDAAITETLQKRALLGRSEFIDVASPQDIQLTLCAADVVVVIGDDDAWATPHRALEAMACGRAVVVAASDVACRDHITSGQNAVVVPAEAPDQIADAVAELLADAGLRSRLGKAAERQAIRSDLAARSPELAELLTEATGVAFSAALPPLEEVTQPAPVARAVPATPLSVPAPAPGTPMSTSRAAVSLADDDLSAPHVAPKKSVRASSPSSSSSAASASSFALPPMTTPQGPDKTDKGKNAHSAHAVEAGDAAHAVGAHLTEHTDESSPQAAAKAQPQATVELNTSHLDAPTLADDDFSSPNAVEPSSPKPRRPQSHQSQRPFVSRSVVKGLSAEAEPQGDVWAGDTMLDPNAMQSPSKPPPERVKAAMLNTDSGSVSAKRPASLASPDPTGPDETAFQTRRPVLHSPTARSLEVGLSSANEQDPWAPDTIADASPVPEPTRVPSQERALITHPPKSFLVEHGVGDMTAEDAGDADDSSSDG